MGDVCFSNTEKIMSIHKGSFIFVKYVDDQNLYQLKLRTCGIHVTHISKSLWEISIVPQHFRHLKPEFV